MQSAASGGVAMPPAAKFGTGRRPFSATKRTSSSGAAAPSRAAGSSSGGSAPRLADRADHAAQVAHRLDDVAAARLALGADHRRALADAAQRLAEVARAAHEGRAEVVLPDVVLVVGRRQHLALVDEVDAERLEHARLDEVADAHLRHHRDRDRALDALDHLDRRTCAPRRLPCGCRRARARAPSPRGAGVLGDLRLLGRGDVHDHAALQHLGEADLELEGLRARAAPRRSRCPSAALLISLVLRDAVGAASLVAAASPRRRPTRLRRGVGWPSRFHQSSPPISSFTRKPRRVMASAPFVDALQPMPSQ